MRSSFRHSATTTVLRLAAIAVMSLAATLGSTMAQNSDISGDTDRQFVAANARFEAGDMPGAIKEYQALVDAGQFSADLFFNLGNAHYRSGDQGVAALCYHRALTLEPTMGEARQNLRVIENQTGALRVEVEGLDQWIVRLGPGFFTVIGTLGLWVAILVVAVIVCIRRSRPWLPGLLVTALLFAALAASAAYAKWKWNEDFASRNYAVVTAAGVSALVNAVPDAAPVIELPPGSRVRIEQERGPWRYIAIPGDLHGWVHADHASHVWPPSAASSDSDKAEPAAN